MFQTKVVEKIKIHIFVFSNFFFFSENRAIFWDLTPRTSRFIIP